MGSPGASPTELTELTRVADRISFLYLERCAIHREANAITATDDAGTIHIPAAALSVLLLGPGTRVSHHAMMLIAESGATAVWVGEQGVRYYAHGRGLTNSAHLLQAQASLVSSRTSRLRVARCMYGMRFPGENVSRMTMQQLRGREGARVRKLYRTHATRTGVPWNGRDYDADDFTASDPINQALSAANTALYGVVHSVIVAIGCSPGLGFVHTGHRRSFVYDIADLYKAELTIPLAFDIASDPPVDIAGVTRRALRDSLFGGAFLSRCVADIQTLLTPDQADTASEGDTVHLWDGSDGVVEAGRSYRTDSA